MAVDASGSGEERPTSAEEVVDKHGRDVLQSLAEDGLVAAQAILDVADERGGTDA